MSNAIVGAAILKHSSRSQPLNDFMKVFHAGLLDAARHSKYHRDTRVEQYFV